MQFRDAAGIGQGAAVQQIRDFGRLFSYTKTKVIMLRNFFKIAFRQLKKQGFYSAIKIGGLDRKSVV